LRSARNARRWGAGEIASVFESTNCDGESIGGIPSCRLWVCQI
jgi:hypothetical protein